MVEKGKNIWEDQVFLSRFAEEEDSEESSEEMGADMAKEGTVRSITVEVGILRERMLTIYGDSREFLDIHYRGNAAHVERVQKRCRRTSFNAKPLRDAADYSCIFGWKIHKSAVVQELFQLDKDVSGRDYSEFW